MFKRALLVLLALSLPLAFAGSDRLALADDTTPPPTAPEWTGAPDLQEDSGRFYAVSGVKNAGLTPDTPGEDPGKLVVVLLFEEKPAANDIRIRMFDADTQGLWDQRDDLRPLAPEDGIRRPYDTKYRVYPDPTGGVANALVNTERSTLDPTSVQPIDRNGDPEPGAPVTYVVEKAALQPPILGTNATWCEIYDAEGQVDAWNATIQKYVYTLFVTLEPGPAPLTGLELNGMKLAHTGEARLPRGTLLGFIGGTVDIRTVDGVASSEDPMPGQSYRVPDGEGTRQLTNQYTGEWDLRFRYSQLCEDLVIYEGDADWNKPIPLFDLGNPSTWFGDPNPTGIPPDDGGVYQVEDPNSGDMGSINNEGFAIPLTADLREKGLHGIAWELWAPGETTMVLSSYTDPRPAHPGHPSITADQQESTYPTVSEGDFQFATLTKEEADKYGPTPTDDFWHWKWHGVDSRNLIWVKASGGFGPPIEGIETKGTVHCTLNSVNTPIANAQILFESVPVGTPGPVGVTTDALGAWSTFLLTEGTWIIKDIVLPPGAPYTFQRSDVPPAEFTVGACEGDDVVTTGVCTPIEGSLSGRVYCDNNVTGEFDAVPLPADEGIVGVTVSLTKVGDAVPTATTTTVAGGTYSFLQLAPGSYKVEVFPSVDPALAFRSALSATSRTEVVPSGGGVEDVDFRFCCYGDLTGRVYCDNDENEGYVSPPDKPLDGVTVELLRGLTVVATDVTDAVGEYEFTYQAVGNYTVRVRASTLPPGVTALGPTSSQELVSCDATAEFDFRYRCPASISGHVWRETIDCDGKITAGDIPIQDVLVTLIRLDDNTKGPWFDTTDALGYYEFSPVDPGTYQILVNELQTAVVRLKASNPVPAVISPLVVEPLGNYPDNDFFFCPGTITVRVYKKLRGENCLNVITTGDTPIPGVEVVLVGTVPPVAAQMLETGLTGEVVFTNLEAGEYKMTIDETQDEITIYVAAFGATEATATLPAGGAIELPSVWCDELCKIYGQVLREREGCDCDSEWVSRGPLAGVRVELRKAGEAALLDFRITNAAGFYEFDDLVAGSYVVSIPGGDAVLVDMTATSLSKVPVLECPAEVNFYYGTASLDVEVVVDVACDGRPDGGLQLVVTLEKLDAPDLGRTHQATTDPVTGLVKFPTPAMNALQPGLWKVSVPAQPTLIPQDGLEQTILLTVCDCEDLRFRFCGTGSIVGKVWKETCDCDGLPARTDPGIEGVEVTLTPSNSLVGVRKTLTDANGEFEFLNLPRGGYVVTVDPNDAMLVGLTASSPTFVNVSVVPPNEYRADFVFCDYQPARLFGYVFEEPLGKCTGTFDPGDTGIENVVVGLSVLGPVGWTVLPPQLTDVNGRYDFYPLTPGTYRVSVWDQQPLLVNLSATTETEIQRFALDCAEEKEFDVGFAPQALGGLVFLNPATACDEDYDPADDEVIPGVEITIIKLDDPQSGLTRVAYTNAAGVYLFEDIPAGLYEVSVTGGVPSGLRPSTSEVQEMFVPICQARRVNFGYCPPLGQICGKVWVNPVDSDCNEIFELGDVPLVGVTVELEKMDEPNMGRTLFTTTDVDGDYCFYRLPAGLYEVRVPGGQAQLVNFRPFGPTEVLVTLPPGGSEEVDFPYCEECEVACCIGDLHEVVVETKFWVGYTDEPGKRWFDVYAYFFDGCTENAREIDYAGLFYQGAFPGAETGYNDVLTLESVRVEEGWAVVRLRLTAQGCLFPRGFFGKKCRTVAVWFNGQWSYGKSVFRCECVRPGSWFTWSQNCDFPECEEYFSPAVLSSMILEGRPGGCNARYLTIDTYSWESWVRCERGPKECVEQSESCKCGYNYVALELDYWVDHHNDPHQLYVDLEKWGYDIVDGLELRFTGSEWHGRKVGWNRMVFVTDVWRVSRHEYADLWRVRIHLRACDRPDGNPSALPEQLEINTVLDNWRHDYWLELGGGKNRCVELGMRMWEGEPMGINILRWVSVEDAAWCPPYVCDLGCDRTNYCRTCPEPVGCDGTEKPCDCDCDCEQKTAGVDCDCANRR